MFDLVNRAVGRILNHQRCRVAPSFGRGRRGCLPLKSPLGIGCWLSLTCTPTCTLCYCTHEPMPFLFGRFERFFQIYVRKRPCLWGGLPLDGRCREGMTAHSSVRHLGGLVGSNSDVLIFPPLIRKSHRDQSSEICSSAFTNTAGGRVRKR